MIKFEEERLNNHIYIYCYDDYYFIYIYIYIYIYFVTVAHSIRSIQFFTKCDIFAIEVRVWTTLPRASRF